MRTGSARVSRHTVARLAGRGGFTLIELVISTGLMAMILGSAYACLRASVSSQELVDGREEALQNARVALALISADLRAACPLSRSFEFIGVHRQLAHVQGDSLDFATHHYTPRRPRESDWCEVSYFLDVDPRTGEFSLWRRRDATPDDDPFSGGTREEIARAVRGLRFEYYDGFDWYDDWGDTSGQAKAQSSWKDRPNLIGLPEAVRITLWLDPAQRRGQTQDEKREPPLVFQTVVRLNLAGISSRSTASDSVSSFPGETTAAPESIGPAP